VWVYEWCIRTHDGDWNFWTLGTTHLLSDPVLMEDAYPWKDGERPYRIGYGNLEAHRIVPQSPVETLRPLQQEINDITNLRLDNLKQVIQPVALVKRGKKIDTDALKRRYPVLFVDDPKRTCSGTARRTRRRPPLPRPRGSIPTSTIWPAPSTAARSPTTGRSARRSAA
jgi:hypothetical protein